MFSKAFLQIKNMRLHSPQHKDISGAKRVNRRCCEKTLTGHFSYLFFMVGCLFLIIFETLLSGLEL